MRRIYPLIVLLAVTLHQAKAEPTSANAILAIVDDVVITTRDVQRSIAPEVELLYRQYGNQPALLDQKAKELQREKIEDLIARQLILKDFTNSGYNLPESFIEDRVQETIRQEYFGDRPKLMKTLREDGRTYLEYQKGIRDRIIVDFLHQKHVSQELIISPNKIETYYKTNQTQFQVKDEVKLRMIVLTMNKEEPDIAKKMCQEILKKIDSGVPFAELASIYSEGSQRVDGGDWGWRERGFLDPELDKRAFSLKKGEHSGVVETKDSCYIMLVEDTRQAHVKPLAEVRVEIEKTLLAEERNRLYQKYIDRLKSKAYVRFF